MNRTMFKRLGIAAAVMPVMILLLAVPALTGTAYAEVTDDDCLACHSDKELEAETERGKSLKLFVPENALEGSAHEGLSCTDCHRAASEDAWDEIPHGDPPPKARCDECHDDVMELYKTTDVHGKAWLDKSPRAPYCSDCHGGHDMHPMASPESVMSKKHQHRTCGRCHGEEKLNLEDNITKRNLIDRYLGSVHWVALEAGKDGASCTDCHGHHTILTSASPQSTVARTGIMDVCGKCHEPISRAYVDGPHGRSLKHGNNDVPNCIVCHGDHDMASLRDRQGDAKQWASTQVCIWCHNNVRMMARYGLTTIPVQSYMKDFHGLTQRGTLGASATCSDCHDPHRSLPSDHPSSRMHLTNRGTACGKCHGQVTDSFAQSFTHKKAMQKPGGGVETIVKNIYIILILVSVGGMLFYNFLIWQWSVRKKFRTQRKQKHVKRMGRYERTSHIFLLLSFFTLVVTGFALKFPEAFWAKWLFSIGMTEAVRAGIHRFAAMIMTLDLILFSFYMLFVKRGRCMLKEILPAKRDFTDFFTSVKYYSNPGKSGHPPRYDVFNFAEKFEFWALLWGTVVMLVSGVILWLPKALPEGWPSWVIGVARVVHFYEALLATLAILVWHMYHVMFHPAEYPLNTSWITGYITEGEARHRFEDDAVKKMRKSGQEPPASAEGKPAPAGDTPVEPEKPGAGGKEEK